MKTPEPRIETEAHNLVEMTNFQIGEAIKADFGLDIKIEEKVIGGYQSQVYKAILDGNVIFIRINKDPQKFEVEIAGYKILEEKEIPVPKVIAFNPNPKNIGHPTMIMSGALGKSIGQADLSPEQGDVVYEEVGRTLHSINEFQLEGFGPLEISNGQPRGRFNSYKEQCEFWGININKAIDFLIKNNLLSKEEIEKLQRIFLEISSQNISKAQLLHRDMHLGHIFTDGKKITGIIDLERMQAGDPRYDIAMSLVFQNDRQQEHFKRGYGSLADDPMVLKYVMLITAEKILFRSGRGLHKSAAEKTKLLKEMLATVA